MCYARLMGEPDPAAALRESYSRLLSLAAHEFRTPASVVGGYLLEGVAPWFTGWGMVDSLLVAGRTSDDGLVFAMLDVVENDTLHADPLDLMAVRASGTVTPALVATPAPRMGDEGVETGLAQQGARVIRRVRPCHVHAHAAQTLVRLRDEFHALAVVTGSRGVGDVLTDEVDRAATAGESSTSRRTTRAPSWRSPAAAMSTAA